jgi:hypothetical protein
MSEQLLTDSRLWNCNLQRLVRYKVIKFKRRKMFSVNSFNSINGCVKCQ